MQTNERLVAAPRVAGAAERLQRSIGAAVNDGDDVVGGQVVGCAADRAPRACGDGGAGAGALRPRVVGAVVAQAGAGSAVAAGQSVLDSTGNLKAVQKLLGHSSITATGDIYTDWDIDQLEATMRSVVGEDDASGDL
jgi:hypothetical protein